MARGDYPSAKQDQFMLRFPDGMRDRIRAAAEANNRSMNAEIVAILEAAESQEKGNRLRAFLNEGRKRHNRKLSRENAALKARLAQIYSGGDPELMPGIEAKISEDLLSKMIEHRVKAVVDDQIRNYRTKLDRIENAVAEQLGVSLSLDWDDDE